MDRERALRAVLADFRLFWTHVLGRPPRPYQLEPARAILDSIFHQRGYSFTCMLARQMGKNELSAALEAYLLTLYQRRGGSVVKAAPTWKPQIVNSMMRLDTLLENPLTRGQVRTRFGYIKQLGQARVYFFSGQPGAQVVGATASLALEVDEAQDFDADKYAKDFRPMGATGNATSVLYGTAWDGGTLLEQQIAENLRLEAHDGVRRHFQYDWTAGAAANAAYGRYVLAERERLGESHPIFQTQYLLQSVAGTGRLFGPAHLAQLRGSHERQRQPVAGTLYVAGLDLAGEEENPLVSGEFVPYGARDSAVLTLARMIPGGAVGAPGVQEPQLELVEHYAWTGKKHRALLPQLIDLLRRVWQVRRVVVDATGVGEAVASFLVGALGESRVTPFTFSTVTKSALAYSLLAAVNSGRVRAYADDGSAESAAFWQQCRMARYAVRVHERMSFDVDRTEGHDDFLMSLALVVEAAAVTPIRRATGRSGGNRE